MNSEMVTEATESAEITESVDVTNGHSQSLLTICIDRGPEKNLSVFSVLLCALCDHPEIE